MNAKSILIVLFLAGWCYAQKEGYTQAFFLPPHENDGNDIYPIFTVPAGKEFVLQMLYTEGLDTGWFLLKNDVAWLFGDNHIQRIVGTNNFYYYYGNTRTKLDFPDETAVLKPNTELSMAPMFGSEDWSKITLAGYFRKLPDCPKADMTGDCIVDFRDLAFLASQWLNSPNSP